MDFAFTLQRPQLSTYFVSPNANFSVTKATVWCGVVPGRPDWFNTEAYPASANAQDSLSDGYLAAGQKDLALAAEEKCLELLPNEKGNTNFLDQLKKHAEEKIAELKSGQK